MYRGDPVGAGKVGLGLVSRAAFIGLGLAAAGERDPKQLLRYSLAGSAGVELFVLGWVWFNAPERL